MKELRPAIIRMYQNGIPMREISRIFDVPKSTIIDDIKRFEKPEPMKTVQEEAQKGCKNHKKPSTYLRNAQAESNDQKKLFTKADQKTGDFR
uniref:Uncharacterized protein n=1 Tax=Acrobeloides nanus TaxID=290746 RepID=A0A914DMQ3_9BILA